MQVPMLEELDQEPIVEDNSLYKVASEKSGPTESKPAFPTVDDLEIYRNVFELFDR